MPLIPPTLNGWLRIANDTTIPLDLLLEPEGTTHRLSPDDPLFLYLYQNADSCTEIHCYRKRLHFHSPHYLLYKDGIEIAHRLPADIAPEIPPFARNLPGEFPWGRPQAYPNLDGWLKIVNRKPHEIDFILEPTGYAHSLAPGEHLFLYTRDTLNPYSHFSIDHDSLIFYTDDYALYQNGENIFTYCSEPIRQSLEIPGFVLAPNT